MDDFLHIHIWNNRGVDCSECAAIDLDSGEVVTERIEGDSGIVGLRFVCLACAHRQGLDLPCDKEDR